MAVGTFGTMGSDREERINYPRMREYRLKRTKEAMEKSGIGCLVTWDPYSIRYITGVYVTIPLRWAESALVILPRNGDPHSFALTSFSPYVMREELPWLKDKIWPGIGGNQKLWGSAGDTAPVVDKVTEIMAAHGISKETVGLDCTTNSMFFQEAFSKQGIKVVDGKVAMFEAKNIKNQDEIELMRISCAIAEAAFADIRNAIRPGIKECELVGIGMKTLYSLGCDETMEFVCATGPRTNPLHIDFTDRMVRPGDLIVVDINGSSYNGYKTCYYRTFCCGKASQEQKDTYEECRAMMYAGIGAVKAGNTTWDICKNWPDSPKYWGYENWSDVFGYAVGHGLGLPLHEPPIISYTYAKKNPFKLEQGMCIALETWTGKRGGTHGVRLEEVMAVTKDGYDMLTKYPVNELLECDV